MPINPCSSNGKPGYKFGDSGKCYTYTAGNASSRQQARNSAIEQERAARAGGWTERSNDMDDDEERRLKKELPALAPAEQMYADAMLAIASQYGKLADGDENGIWVSYEEPSENEEADIGVKCSNCFFHESESVCRIVAREIMPEGKCRLAAIPPGLVDSSMEDEDEDEDDVDDEPSAFDIQEIANLVASILEEKQNGF